MRFKQINGHQMQEGAGAVVVRLFPTPETRWPATDPFLLLDDFRVAADAGFPEHPHRGFEIITYILQGGFRHQDSLGYDIRARKGEAMHFVTGRGVVHSEMPIGQTRGLQLWINLPRAQKQIDPSVQLFSAEQLPLLTADWGESRVIVGDGSPLMLNTPLRYEVITLRPGKDLSLEIPADWHGLIYALSGRVQCNGLVCEEENALIAEGESQLKLRAEEGQPVQVVFLAGKQQHESVRFYGPYVD